MGSNLGFDEKNMAYPGSSHRTRLEDLRWHLRWHPVAPWDSEENSVGSMTISSDDLLPWNTKWTCLDIHHSIPLSNIPWIQNINQQLTKWIHFWGLFWWFMELLVIFDGLGDGNWCKVWKFEGGVPWYTDDVDPFVAENRAIPWIEMG